MSTPLDLLWRFPLVLTPTGNGEELEVSCPQLPALHAVGESVNEACANGYKAVLVELAALMAQYRPIPECSYPVPTGSQTLLLDPIPALKVGIYMALRERFPTKYASFEALEAFKNHAGIATGPSLLDPSHANLEMSVVCALLKHFDLEASLTLPFLTEP